VPITNWLGVGGFFLQDAENRRFLGSSRIFHETQNLSNDWILFHWLPNADYKTLNCAPMNLASIQLKNWCMPCMFVGHCFLKDCGASESRPLYLQLWAWFQNYPGRKMPVALKGLKRFWKWYPKKRRRSYVKNLMMINAPSGFFFQRFRRAIES